MLILCRNNIGVLQIISISSHVLFSSFLFNVFAMLKVIFLLLGAPLDYDSPTCLYTKKKTLYCYLIFTFEHEYGEKRYINALHYYYYYYLPLWLLFVSVASFIIIICPSWLALEAFILSLYFVACFNLSLVSLVILISLPFWQEHFPDGYKIGFRISLVAENL